MSGSLAQILDHAAVWRSCEIASLARPVVETGFAGLDAELPGGGWPTGMLTEILARREGIGELRLIAPALAALSGAGKFLVWVAPPHLPNAPALAAAGIDLARLVVVRAGAQDALWAVEQALRSNAAGAVLAWPPRPRFADLRRLQLAAEGRQALALLFRPIGAAAQPSPAPLRLRLAAQPCSLEIQVLKRRGRPQQRPVQVPLPAPVRRPELHDLHALDRNPPATPAPRNLRPSACDIRILHA